jgi:hypothetical protein
MSFYTLANDHLSLLLGNGAASSWSSDEQARMKLIRDSGMRRAYNPPPLPGRRAHQWSFLHPRYTISGPAPYSEGTVAIAAGVVTLTGGTFPAWSADGEFEVGGMYYLVDSRDSDTQLTLEDTGVAFDAGENYVLRQHRWTMPADFGGIEGDITLRKTIDNYRISLQHIHEEDIRKMRSVRDYRYEHPIYYTVYPKSYDGSAAPRWFLEIYPGLEGAQLLDMRYRANPPELNSTTNAYPLGGEMHYEMFLQSILAEAETRLFDQPGEHFRRFMEALSTSVSLDEQQMAPDSLGRMRDGRSEEYDLMFTDPHAMPYQIHSGIVIPEGMEDFF